jgi:hypothetical protein
MRWFGAIEKVEEHEDGTVTVTGIASSEAIDSDGEIITADAMRDAIPDYMKFGAVREMHQPIAAGTALSCEVGDDGKTRLEALVVDPGSVKKVLSGVLKGFSIGGKVIDRGKENAKIITRVRLTEISLVDRPANPEAIFSLAKMEDAMAEDMDTQPEDILKGGEVFDAGWALNALQIISALLEKEASEPKEEAGQIAALKAAITNLKSFISMEIVEPGEDEIQQAESPGDLGKAGAKYSKATAAAIKAIRSKAAEIQECLKAFDDMDDDDKEDCNTGKAEESDDLQKAELIEKSETLSKVSAERDELKAELAKAHAKLAEKPLRIVPVAKEDDGSEPKIAKSVPTDPLEAMRMVHKSGGHSYLNHLG